MNLPPKLHFWKQNLSGRVALERDAVDGDGDGVGRVPVGLLGRRRGRQLGLAPRGLEHVLGVVEDLHCSVDKARFVLVQPMSDLHPVQAN